MTDALAARAGAALDRLTAGAGALGIALSGGGDSVALLHLAQAWAAPRGIRVHAATVDHHLRPESRAEAMDAGRAAAALAIPHDILDWHRPSGAGNLMAKARDGRASVLATWARRNGLDAVLLGHTADDVAETLLMRLSRGAGVDGLAAMAESREACGARFLRPLLAIGRDELRAWLTARGIGWTDDPSNDDPRFDRARIRAAMAALGLDRRALVQTAQNAALARDALDAAARATAAGFDARRGSLRLPRAAFDAAPAEIRRRLAAAAIRWVTGADWPPRRDSALRLLDTLAKGRPATLDGAILRPHEGWLVVFREPAAAARAAPGGEVWDNRWRIAPLPRGATVAPLGEAALATLDWRGAGFLRLEAAATPAVTLPGGRRLAPVIAPDPDIRATPLREAKDFLALLSH